MYRLETEAKGSMWYRNPKGSHIEPERVAQGFLYRVDPVGRGL